ncbi:MAG: DUF2357 domain-containing protein [Selenomonadaceae bacterium]|nr:DUF2357 domain-containing protein [Selenomonadaceae bacterium]
MAEYLLTITPQNKNSFDVKLTDGTTDSIDENHFLYCDWKYALKFKLDGIKNFSAYVNGEQFFSSGRIFQDCYGFAQLSFIVELNDGQVVNLHSEFLPVLVKNDALSDSVRAMVDYIYENHEEFLRDGDLSSRALAGRKKSSVKNLEERLRLAENIAAAYEKNYSYFKANCRFKTEKVPALDSFEKLQQVTPAALQYIAAHPENLAQVKSTVGVRIGGRVFQPQKTLTLKNVHSRDTYENRAVLGFLQKISADLSSLYDNYEKRAISKNLNFDEDYINSAQYLLRWSESTLEKISTLREKFNRLFKLYSDALQIPLPTNLPAPQPTPIFLSVPQYNQIFLGIHEWFKCGACDFAREDFMLELAKNWNLYEKYLLLKFIAYFKASEYELLEKFRFNYRLPNGYRYAQTDMLNTFIFSNGANKITIYYQPVIYNKPLKSSDSAAGLYRNNSRFGEGKGTYYVPDFIIKIETPDEDYGAFGSSAKVKYLIVDAKFSSAQTVRKIHLPEFILKYVFSISTIEPDEEISGYRLVYGKCSSRERVESVYDNQHQKNKIEPGFELVPLMENFGNETLSLYKILTV